MVSIISAISRKVPLFRGKYRLMRLLLRSQLKRLYDIIIIADEGIGYKLPNINEIIGFSIYINGSYEKEYQDYFIKNIPINGVFFDIGANIGSICIPVAKARPDITIVAVEASSKMFGYLCYNVQMNSCKNIHLIHKAVSNINNHSVEFNSPKEFFGKGSLNINNSEETETVQTTTIDQLVNQFKIAKIDLMKVDVEGYEKMIFLGMQYLNINYTVDKIVFEFSEWAETNSNLFEVSAAQKLLIEYGYKIGEFNNPPKISFLVDFLIKGDHMLIAIR